MHEEYIFGIDLSVGALIQDYSYQIDKIPVASDRKRAIESLEGRGKMSDDLVSRKAVLDILAEERVRNSILASPAFTELLVQRVKELPRAFDKERVLEGLRQEAMYELGVSEEEFDLDEGEYSAYCSIPFSQAKKIIEKGGME